MSHVRNQFHQRLLQPVNVLQTIGELEITQASAKIVFQATRG